MDNLLKQASAIAGVKISKGAYITLSSPESKKKFLEFCIDATNRIVDERKARRNKIKEIVTLLTLSEKIHQSSAAKILEALKTSDATDESNVHEINVYDNSASDSDTPSLSWGTPKAYIPQTVNVKTSYKNTHDLGTFLLMHGCLAYSGKLKQINTVIDGIRRSIDLDADLNIDLSTLTGIEFIKSDSFTRYNERFMNTINEVIEAKDDEEPIDQTHSVKTSRK